MIDTSDDRRGPAAWALPATALGAAAFGFALVCLLRGVRAVMTQVDGYCAEGGPYVIAKHCPKGTTVLVIGGFWGLTVAVIALLAVLLRTTDGNVAPSIGGLMWAALFAILGVNFLLLGFDAGGGGALGWIGGGIVFLVMAAPGLLGVRGLARAWRAPTNVANGRARVPARSAVPAVALGTAVGACLGWLAATAAMT